MAWMIERRKKLSGRGPGSAGSHWKSGLGGSRSDLKAAAVEAARVAVGEKVRLVRGIAAWVGIVLTLTQTPILI